MGFRWRRSASRWLRLKPNLPSNQVPAPSTNPQKKVRQFLKELREMPTLAKERRYGGTLSYHLLKVILEAEKVAGTNQLDTRPAACHEDGGHNRQESKAAKNLSARATRLLCALPMMRVRLADWRVEKAQRATRVELD